jgi:hypothetical protein
MMAHAARWRSTNRQRLGAELDRALRSGGSTVVQAVTGMGGIGKTTTAIEYAHRHHDEFDIAWWVPADDPGLIPQRLAEPALARDLTAATTPVGVGVDASGTRRQRWGHRLVGRARPSPRWASSRFRWRFGSCYSASTGRSGLPG